jgi:signal transduction histidine kinase
VSGAFAVWMGVWINRVIEQSTERAALIAELESSRANVRRHSGAQAAHVLLAYAGDRVRLVVRDDGCGFDPVRANGFGLRGMRARAEQVDGALTVHSDPEKGTTIELEVPA